MKTKYYVLAVLMLMTAAACNKQEINKVTNYTGVVVEESTRTPIPNVKVSVTNGSRVHCATVTNEQGAFELTVDFNQITTDYYLFLDGTPDLPVTFETLRGMGQANYDFGEIVLYNMNTPEVTTAEPTEVFARTAKIGGTVTDDKGLVITERGVCWGTDRYPSINGEHAKVGTGLGAFSLDIDGLEKETTYYVRAYAINSAGVGYGEELSFTTTAIQPGVFSVSDNKKVYISQGNLQYQASTNTWRFAEHPWDFVGGLDNGNEYGNVYENGVKCDNSLIDSLYTGWIDLFAWGTSGYNHGAVCYQPWSTNGNYKNYYAYGNEWFNLNDMSGQADWGHNPISNGGNGENQWRTLTVEEFNYLNNRNNMHHIGTTVLDYPAVVNGVAGRIYLPDNWDKSIYNLDMNHYQSNMISASDWTTIFEENGAVFLPNSGYRDGTKFHNSGYDSWGFGAYWTSSYYMRGEAYASMHDNYTLDKYLYRGFSVRLVRDVE